VPKVDPETSSQGLLVCYAKVNGVIRGAVVHLDRRSALGLFAVPALLGSLPALLSGALSGTWEWVDDWTLITIPEAGHFVQQDASEKVTRSILMWLKR